MKNFTLCALLCSMIFACGGVFAQQTGKTYRNPVINRSVPDPTVLRAADGTYYLYATEDIRNVPIFKSTDMVNWTFVGTAFTDETRPDFVKNDGNRRAGIWAPEVNYINGKYVLTCSMSTWGGHWTNGIGSAVSDSPEGPFKMVANPMFIAKEIDVENSIDQTTFRDDDGKLYMFWGSFFGIYGVELNEDGTLLKDGTRKRQIAGTAYEGTYIHKKDGYYYMFASVGTCCEGLKSTYRTVVGRSDNLWGPYLNKQGESMMDNKHEVLIQGDDFFKGTGHNSQIVQDDAGSDYLYYHAYSVEKPNERVCLMDRIEWVEGWPYVKGGVPSTSAPVPVINKK